MQGKESKTVESKPEILTKGKGEDGKKFMQVKESPDVLMKA